MAKSKTAGRKRSRKKKPERLEGSNLSCTVGVRLTEAEHEQLKAEAAGCHKSKAAILRAVWRGKPLALAPARLPARLMNPWEQQSYFAWVDVGNGLNKFLSQTPREQAVWGEASALLDEIKEALAQFRAFVAREEIEENYDDFDKPFTV